MGLGEATITVECQFFILQGFDKTGFLTIIQNWCQVFWNKQLPLEEIYKITGVM